MREKQTLDFVNTLVWNDGSYSTGVKVKKNK